MIGVRQDTGYHILFHGLLVQQRGHPILQLSQLAVHIGFDGGREKESGVVGAEVVQVEVHRPLNEGGHAPASVLLIPALQDGFLLRGEIEGESLFFAHKLLLSGA